MKLAIQADHWTMASNRFMLQRELFQNLKETDYAIYHEDGKPQNKFGSYR